MTTLYKARITNGYVTVSRFTVVSKHNRIALIKDADGVTHTIKKSSIDNTNPNLSEQGSYYWTNHVDALVFFHKYLVYSLNELYDAVRAYESAVSSSLNKIEETYNSDGNYIYNVEELLAP